MPHAHHSHATEAHHGHHHHNHGVTDYNRAFVIGVGLNLGFVIIEGLYGLMAGSLA